MIDKNTLTGIQKNCISNIENTNYKSYDVFDALTNPLLDKISYKKPLLRRIFIQLGAKSPVDMHWLGMKKMVHTKTVSDLLWYYSISDVEGKEAYINKYFDMLMGLKNKKLAAWGLNFPYATRFIDADIDMPNLYNTMNSAIAICYSYDFLDAENKPRAAGILADVFGFLNNDLGFIDEEEKGWYLYYPGQHYPTYNVNAFALYFLSFLLKLKVADAADVTSKAKKIINLLVSEQEADGSWFYSRSAKGKWVDGFHSAFVVESLAFAYKNGFNDEKTKKSLVAGVDFYYKYMFTADGFPKYFLNSGSYPIEAQNIAQAIQTLSLLIVWLGKDYKDMLAKCLDIAVSNLYSPKGYFYYKKEKFFTYKQRYIRWATTPLILALEYSKKAI